MTTEFYKDLEIFVTGGSGVVGKATIEKLLRSCDVKKIYMLLRCKKGVSGQDRLQDIKNSRIFKVLKEKKPNELDKLIAIPGDIELHGFGISSEHREMLKNVAVFFHSAATTRFDQPLSSAIKLNLKSTLEALSLAQTFQNLKVFLYVSTFFSNVHLTHIQDKIYPAVFDWRSALKVMDTKYKITDPSCINAITEKIITGFPNTYVFTKHLAEQMVNDHRHKLPVAIYRPSIVTGAIEEPEPGFTESMTGLMGLLFIWGTGLLKVFHANPDKRIDITPLDVGTKLMLMFTAKIAKLKREEFAKATPVSMFSSKDSQQYGFKIVAKTISNAVLKYPYQKSLLIPTVTVTNCPFMYNTLNFFLQLVPAYLIDILLRIFGRKPTMMSIQRKIFTSIKAVNFFVTNDFKTDGISNYDEFARTEHGTEFDIKSVLVEAESYEGFSNAIEILSKGCRKFLLNEDESTIPRCRKILKVKIFLYKIVQLYVLYIVGCAIYRRLMGYFNE